MQDRKGPPKREQRKMAKSRHGNGQLEATSHKPQEIRAIIIDATRA